MNDFQPIGPIAAGIVEKLAARRIERHAIKSREQWLALRQQDVTASVAGALLGVHDYITPFELWALKSGKAFEDVEESAPMRRGRLLEPVALELLREMQPRWIVSSPGEYLRDPVARLGATPDAYAWDLDDPDHVEAAKHDDSPPFGIIQVKSVEPSVFRRKWRQEDGTVEPPLWIVIQAVIEARLAGAQWAKVAALTVGHGADLHLVDVPLHEAIYDRIAVEVADFWKLVDAGVMPPFDYGRDGEAIARLYGQDDGEEIDLVGDNRAAELAAQHVALSATKTEAEHELKAVKAELIAKMGTAAVARIQGGRITAQTISRKAYSVAASSYRTPRVSFDKEKTA